MANEDHLALLKQGVAVWNHWRQEHGMIHPDLKGADLNHLNLSGVNFSQTNLSSVNFSVAELHNASLYRAHLSHATLIGTGLENTDLNDANLRYANLSLASLRGANLRGANLQGAMLHGVGLLDTLFASIDLRLVQGLLEINHLGPSQVELYTVQLPQDGSALHFLRGAGVPDEWIDFWRTTMLHPIQYHSVFISYSSEDIMPARRLHADLQAKGVRCWFAPEDMKIGDRIRTRIDEAIHLQDKLLLLLSKHALKSDWVEDEVEAALEKEKRQHRDVLFPVRLDDSVLQTTQPWAAKLRRQRHIGDFTGWKDHDAYQHAFARLLRDLKAGSAQTEAKSEIDPR